METSRIFDRLLQMRDVTRWAWDESAYSLVVETAALAAFLNPERGQEMTALRDYWRLQSTVLANSSHRERIQSSFERFFVMSFENAEYARRAMTELREVMSGADTADGATLRLPKLQRFDSGRYELLKKRVLELASEGGRLSRVDIHTAAHLDSMATQLYPTGLEVDQYALLVSWVLMQDGERKPDLDLERLRQESERAWRQPVRYTWKVEKNELFVVVRGYSLHGALEVRRETATARGESKFSFSIDRGWGVARGMVAPLAGTFRVAMMLQSLSPEAIDGAVRELTDEVLVHSGEP